MSGYRVVAPVVIVTCAAGPYSHVSLGRRSARQAVHLYRGAPLPPSVPAETVKHLLSRRMIEEDR